LSTSARSIVTAAARRVFSQRAATGRAWFGPTLQGYTRIGQCLTLVAISAHVEAAQAPSGPAERFEIFPIDQPDFSGSLILSLHAADQESIDLRWVKSNLTLDISNAAHYVDPRSFAERYLKPLPESQRQMLCEKISLAVSKQTDPDLSAYRPLLAVRAVLRRPLTPPASIEGLHIGAHLDVFAQIDSQTVYLRGWLLHADGPVARIILTAPDGQEMELADSIFPVRRLDIEKAFAQPPFDGKQYGYGFIACVSLPRPCPAVFGWTFYFSDSAANECEINLNPATTDLHEIRNEILHDIGHRSLSGDLLMVNHLHPALQRVQNRHNGQLEIATTRQYGTPPSSPIASIIIPLYRRYAFMHYQMAQFASDPEMHQVELIYVLDSPEQSLEMVYFAIEIFAIYRVPFKVVFLKTNAGYSKANNFGASYATAPLLLLLNSDVLPAAAGWLGKMVKFYSQTPGIGALGPKLLYEDETLQHAGMYFEMSKIEQLWLNKHYYKGLHRLLPAAAENRPVPAVTGAAMMIARDLFNDLGGLSGDFVHGDFEDSDFCIRLSARGLTHWYLADVELFHLEGQSYPSEVRQYASAYNRWLHTQMWGTAISEIMRQPDFAETSEEIL
jgi:O-antigen biosynthesis protein